MIHVENWREGLDWYRRAFPQAQTVSLPDYEFECLEINGINIEVVNADEKVGAGTLKLALGQRVGFLAPSNFITDYRNEFEPLPAKSNKSNHQR